jgi:hypothetical protein
LKSSDWEAELVLDMRKKLNRHSRRIAVANDTEINTMALDDCIVRVGINARKGCSVTKQASKTAWTKPELKRLGEIKDVAGPSGVGTQGSNNRS